MDGIWVEVEVEVGGGFEGRWKRRFGFSLSPLYLSLLLIFCSYKTGKKTFRLYSFIRHSNPL